MAKELCDDVALVLALPRALVVLVYDDCWKDQAHNKLSLLAEGKRTRWLALEWAHCPRHRAKSLQPTP